MRLFNRFVLATLVLFPQLMGAGLAVSSAPVATQSVVISELQTGATGAAKQEFVELYNPTSSDISIAGWKLQYKSATATATWSDKLVLAGIVKSHGFYLVASKDYPATADGERFAYGLLATAGSVRLRQPSTTGDVTIDTLGWRSATDTTTPVDSETAPAVAAGDGHSLERLPGRLNEDGGDATDTDDNSQDFIIRSVPGPQTAVSSLEVPDPASISAAPDPGSPAGDPPAEVVDDPAPTPVTYLVLQINELLIDPAAPLTDADDEFIELYNPNDTAVDLTGYTLRTGSDFHDFYVLPSHVVDPHEYIALYSSETKLSLTNAGGAAQLLSPLGDIISQSDAYPTASSGQVWGLFDDGWHWSLQSTPARPNILVQPVLTPPASTSSAKKTTAAKPKATTSIKASAIKAAAKPKAAVAKAAKAAKSGSAALLAASQTSTGRWLLIVALGLTIAYATYEFRYDLQNQYLRARRYWRARRSNRPQT